MTRAQGIIWTRVALIVGASRPHRAAVPLGVINPLTMIAPSQMAFELVRI